MGSSIETNWIPVVTPYGNSKCGAFFLPENGDIVVVTFMGDNPNFGIVLGGVWSSSQPPPETGENTGSDLNKDGENNLRFIKSRSGNQIIFDDKDGEEKIQILSSDAKTRFEMLSKDEMIKIETDKDISINAKGKFAIEAEEGVLKFSKGLKLTADEIAIESSSKDVKIKASQNIALEGSTIKLN